MESILIVEDTESLRDVLCTVLSGEGYKVQAAESAEEGLRLFQENDYTLVVSDLRLPNMSGLDLVKETRELNNSVPVIVMTAYGELRTAVLARRGRAREGLDGLEDAGRRVAAVRQSARALRLHVRPPGQKAAVHGLRVRAGVGVEPRDELGVARPRVLLP